MRTTPTLNDIRNVAVDAPQNGDVLTFVGPNWENTPLIVPAYTDYYSTIYDLNPAMQVAGGDTTIILNPANGFTQYGTLITASGGPYTKFGLINGLATGRSWTVRLMVTTNTTYSSSQRNSWWVTTGDTENGGLVWVWPTGSGNNVTSNSVLIYQFLTLDGGNNWVGWQYIGKALAGV